MELSANCRNAVCRREGGKKLNRKGKGGHRGAIDAAELGFDPVRLNYLTATIKEDIAQEKYDGAVVLVARSGAVVLREVLGFTERAIRRVAWVHWHPPIITGRGAPQRIKVLHRGGIKVHRGMPDPLRATDCVVASFARSV